MIDEWRRDLGISCHNFNLNLALTLNSFTDGVPICFFISVKTKLYFDDLTLFFFHLLSSQVDSYAFFSFLTAVDSYAVKLK